MEKETLTKVFICDNKACPKNKNGECSLYERAVGVIPEGIVTELGLSAVRKQFKLLAEQSSCDKQETFFEEIKKIEPKKIVDEKQIIS
jgi:hypothetical protein